MITLKKFQEATLAKLKDYLEAARLSGDPETAYLQTVKPPDGRLPLYRKVPDLESIPYVCLRLPTGGGKTIVGAYSIRVAAQSYIEKDYPVVLWLVPSNSIRTQTAFPQRQWLRSSCSTAATSWHNRSRRMCTACLIA